MTLLDVTPVGLEKLAGHCEAWAGDVAVADIPEVPTAAWNASATAVAAIYTAAGMRGEKLAVRMGLTAEKLGNAAANYRSHDDQSAGRIASVARLI